METSFHHHHQSLSAQFGVSKLAEYSIDNVVESGVFTCILKERFTMFKEFQKFIMRGNVLDLAVGIIIGAAFTTIVNSLVNDVIMPPIGLVVGGIDFSEIKIVLQEAVGDKAEVAINIGLFINALINFLIVAFVVFLLVRSFNRMMERFQRKEEPVPDVPKLPTPEEKLTEAIERLIVVMEKKG
jgi:large conductance mechanosensitive channel